jgi:hypothetical protein
MTAPDEPTKPADRCPECAHPMAHDQRYCVACGARRGALPAQIAVALDDLADRRQPIAGSAALAADPPSAAADRVGDLIPLARAAAVSILLVLGVGSVIGAATTPGGVTSLASTIVVALSPSSHAAPPTRIAAVSPKAGVGSSSGGGGRGSGGGGGSAAAVTTQAQRTVTVSASSSSPTRSTASATTTAAVTTPSTSLPPIHHIWEIVLSDQGYAQSFGSPRSDPYLAKTLAGQGTLVGDYDAVSNSPLANEIALISGQGPTEQTLADCPQYADITPGRIGRHSQVRGQGCLYPSATQTLGSELQIQGLTWRAYIQGIGQKGQTAPAATATTSTSTSTTPTTPTTSTTSTSTSTSGAPATTAVPDTSTATGCPHPAEGATDPAGLVRGRDDYVTWKNPWVYFQSVLDTTTCARDDVGLASLATDLRKESTTPAFSYIAPDPCDDGSTTPCTPNAKDGMGRTDRFLKTVVPEIERSPAYKADGLILITFDEAPQSGPNWSTASCCGQPTFPNLTQTTATGTTGTTPVTTPTLTSPITSTGTTTIPPSSTTTTTPTTTSTTTSTTTTTTTTTTTGAPTTTGPSITTSCPTTATTPTTSTPAGATTPTTAAAPTTSASTTPTTTSTTSSTDCTPVITGEPPGGGQVGLLMISPYVAADKTNEFDIYNHFSTLKTVAQLLGVAPLGYADESGVPAFSPSLFLTTKR